ncbi:MBL fold metallo-hydrolase [Acidisoma cellulosilytica]|uniref:MBL fold metallo-hydrolase n=1 Tax=Acidisoma cellulosilyticum TaxID=2802395 RepID=A0A963Z404_9PROT|nr:MBL fold metallo-hydrolase [Acidisoma cellulosilyticum]
MTTADQWFEAIRFADNVTLIHEPWIKPYFRCNIWHVRGRDADLLFDTGLGVFPLRGAVAKLAEREPICVASHTHYDHIGGHHEFACRCVHAAEAGILTCPENHLTLADGYATDAMFDGFPAGWDAASYRVRPAPPTRVLADGDVIDLGDRQFQVVHTPGHSPGGIALWEQRTGTLLSGDVVYDGPLITDTYHADLGDYDRSMDRLDALPAAVIHGGHFGSFGRTRLRQLISEYRAGRHAPGCHLNPA